MALGTSNLGANYHENASSQNEKFPFSREYPGRQQGLLSAAFDASRSSSAGNQRVDSLRESSLNAQSDSVSLVVAWARVTWRWSSAVHTLAIRS